MKIYMQFENLLFIRNYHHNSNRRRFAEVQLNKMIELHPELKGM